MNIKKLAACAAFTAAAFAMTAAPAFAASKAYLDGFGIGYMNGSSPTFDLVDTSNGHIIDQGGLTVPYSSMSDYATRESAAVAALKDYVFNQDAITLSDSDIVMPYVPQSAITAQIAAATSSIVSPSAMSFATSSRSLNSAFQVSSTRAAFVSYTVDVATTLSLTGGATGTVTLQYANDSGFTSGVTTVQSAVNGNTGTLTIGLALTQTGTAAVTGMIPAGKYVKIVTANTAGTPTFTFRAAQEVLMPSN